MSSQLHSSSVSGARAVVLTLACLLALSACKGGNGEAKASDEKKVDAVPVEVVEATHRSISASYTGTAALEARAESQVIAKTSGVALDVMVEEGDQVRAGQQLVRLDADRARLQVAQTAAQMSKLQNSFARAQKLAAENLISASDHDQLKYDLENARAANRLANLELSYTNVTAPISGVVASRSIKPGNFVQINTPILRIVDVSKLEATLNVPERELATLRPGQPVRLQVDALPGQVFIGTVDRVAPVVDAGSGTFRVICAFEGGSNQEPGAPRQGVLQPGMFGRIRIDHDQRASALVVPRNAIVDAEGDPALFVLRDGKAARVAVRLGYVDGEWVEVLEGVELGDRVVTAGKGAVREGSQVQVVGGSGAREVEAVADASAADDSKDDTATRQ
ncbi:efflux RND transporter periplasmic adaptor subunit [Marilutibacter alkalisoli]|uniref:Efflux RND transporter periplasmic adaptor subunit n=1 Tax=Marilutibacter alkalisoli TaxID=2591633 RepID=A0A514BS15_9GAMM|nr:efflux RND transporter periplasmic adaptor subunit [Lysobacter alkalisoli]QDH70105.1 efflux RND transporter periplasmic adaptor subunit [Lysobacter alkalisoli]